MQTFLPYPDFSSCAAVLDSRRLGKQRVEVFQILRALTFSGYGWRHSVAVRMWRGFVPALVAYGLAMCDEWADRGHADAVRDALLEFSDPPRDVRGLKVCGLLPPWLGNPQLHLSHRSALLRKEPRSYREHFPDVPDDLPYVWPASVYPRWPIRRPRDRPLRPLSLYEAGALVGFDAPRPADRDAVAALRNGDDVALVAERGAGGSTAAVLAGLSLAGPTVWFTPDHGDLGAPPRTKPRATGRRAPTRVAPSIAREPTAEDTEAMRAEREGEPEFRFYRPSWLAEQPVRRAIAAARPGLVVVDAADAMPASDVARVHEVAADLGRPPVLTVGAEPPATSVRGRRHTTVLLR